MEGSSSDLMVILDLDVTAAKECMFARDFSLQKTLNGKILKVAV